MKVKLVALNSKFSHTNLAIRYLAKYSKNQGIEDVEFQEFTINQDRHDILWKLLEDGPDLIGFSCYIWNIDETLKLCQAIKKGQPHIKILLGGPEVSFNTEVFLKAYPYVDLIIRGEGEITFVELMQALQKKHPLDLIEGITFREEETIFINPDRKTLINIDELPYPYQPTECFENQYIYYETSRGCPFKCSFCLSSSIQGVRRKSLEIVKNELLDLFKTKAKTIKFVDRTFNDHKKRTLELFRFISQNNPDHVKIHVEMTAELIDHELLNVIEQLPQDMFQFEIGIQSTYDKTLAEVSRRSDFQRLSQIVQQLIAFNNVHIHLDLIAGLPYESYDDFKVSFNQVAQMRGHKLQLGFLKVLKGTVMEEKKEAYGLVYLDEAPYEIIRNSWMTQLELLKLKQVEHLVEKYYNEQYFHSTLSLVFDCMKPFDFFERFANYWAANDLFNVSHKRIALYQILYHFLIEQNIDCTECLLDDFLMNEPNHDIPSLFWQGDEKNDQPIKHQLLSSQGFKQEILGVSEEISNKKLLNHFRLIKNNDRYMIYVYGNKENFFDRCRKIDVTKWVEGE